HGCSIVGGFIVGFPEDAAESIAKDIDIIKRELPIDILEIFCWTPLPGSEDHKNLYLRKVWMDPDMNNYDVEHVTTVHPRMSKAEWQEAYRKAWQQYYTFDHIETIMRRAAARGQSVIKIMFYLICFYGSITFEGIHPLEGGVFRRKVRGMRRPGMAKEPPSQFYFRRIREFITTTIQWSHLVWKLNRIRRRVENDPQKLEYTDLALTPLTENAEHELELIQKYGNYIPISGLGKGKTPASLTTPSS
ncbi:MAG: hypothetical protein R3351_09045, partial [Nitrospirales bacterium]|nr:hypothetical protein [Nitrospirales bacterium]